MRCDASGGGDVMLFDDGRLTVEDRRSCFALDMILRCLENERAVQPFRGCDTCGFIVCDITGHSKKATLKVVHKHGPCSHLSLDKANVPNVTQILSEDQSRVNLIHFRLSSDSAQNNILNSSKATLPVNSGASIGTGNFIVTVGLGTPKKDLTLVFDTGSNLTWT
ncbi:hypothetical protein TEA_019465 [Camellia sinensis var. sinensis]|uniref:Peptidase A1 domain-containing protein n=1 Tax=Camellia sinensis var. sinensis TaxID=542762 RepID=A0A4S4EN30_CAMSN|nr:hypothetical protein TEA_019465 [Camellia sinensis var. sinensis]